jgi:NAD(P)-dependent dehydrogenase (short-subunit alcohol dehydrogenase family)
MLDRAGQGVLVAYPAMGTPDMLHDEQVREMTCDPKRRKILVTDGRSAVGQALVLALIVAQADQVWVGHAESTDLSRNLTELQTLPQVRVLPLDVTREESVKDAAATMGGQVDIVINTAELHYVQGGNLSSAQELAHAQMDVNYFGLLRLAQEFGPLMRSRAEKGQGNAVAWVNLLSVFALSSFPGRGEFSASKSAAHLFSQSLRAQMQPAGIRVVNVFPGPLDDEWNQNISLPKLGAAALAQAIVKSLREAVEDVYPGDVAQEWLARWRDNPKVLERELALGSRPV